EGAPVDTSEAALDPLSGPAAPHAQEAETAAVAPPAPPGGMRPPAQLPEVPGAPDRNKKLFLIVLGIVVLIVIMLQFMQP
ncbi:MAG TPA: hypothetical protein PKA88_37220, partial [Polyangiaceae bacterium]|nr:hypothetical protein [Polyangiaceae bacterium]